MKGDVVPHALHELGFLAGETGRLVASHDWSATPLGPIESWPSHLKTALAMILRARVPMVLLWGEDGVMLYNDAYAGFAGDRHPGLFARKVRDAWPEVASFNDNVMRVCLAGGTLSYRDEELTLLRNGAADRVWLDLDYSPLVDEVGTPVAVLAIVTETSGKVRAERRLKSDEARLRQFFDQAPGLVAVLDGPDHVFTLANAAYLDLVGRRDILGLPVARAIPEVVEQGFVELLDSVRRNGEPFVGHGIALRLRRTPGAAAETRFVDFVYQPITAANGEVTGIFVQGHDVTEQKQVELALRESEERFRLVAESAPVMLWMGDATGSCVYLNRRQREFWGVDADDVAQFDWSTTIHPDDAPVLAGPFERAMREHEPFSLEVRLRRADGAYRLVQSSAQPRFGTDRSFLGMIGVNVDVTELRETEAAIRSESERLAILNRTGAAIAAELDVERIVQIVSDACLTLVGAQFGAFFYNVIDPGGERYTLYALSGTPRSSFAGLPMPRATAIFRPTFNGEGIDRSDDILADPRYGRSAPYFGMPPGHPPVRSYLAAPVVSRSGEVIGGLFFGHAAPGRFTAPHEEIVAGIAGQAATALDNGRLFAAVERELAQRRDAEAALQALNESLEQRVADAIAERLLAEEALRQAQRMEAIGRLTGGVAHDFNNLMQVISGNLHLLARDLDGNAAAAARIADALEGVNRGAKLAGQLLAFGRRQRLEPKVVHVGGLVARMAELLQRTIGEGVEVRTLTRGALGNSLIDPAQLETALLNLALNARDAMGGRGRLTIEVGNAVLDDAYAALHPEVKPGDYVMLAVSDTGVGIPADILDRVFDPFFSTKPLGEGSGLGLSMVYGFVRQSGGQVNIYSEPGRGTTVRLYLPRVDQPEDVKPSDDNPPVSGGSETILVAEDDDGVRATVVELLADLGYRVLAARDGASALALLEGETPIDLLFTDVVMPGWLRGPELAALARARRPGIAVLFTSGYTENAISHGGAGGTDLLSKPYSREALARKIRQVLASGAAAKAAITVLLCEDDVLIRMNTCDVLQECGFGVVEAGSGAQALAALAANAVDVCVIDIGLPDMTGTDLAHEIRERWPAMPVLFATGHVSVPEAEGVEGFAVLSKPYGEVELRSAIESLIRRA